MSSLASIMDTSLSAMFAARVALQTVGHNIANANTPGYSRQEVVVSARQPVVLSLGALGRGVKVDGVRRLTDTFLQANFRTQTARLQSYTQVDSTLREIESIFGSVDNDHLGDAITQFFNAWSDLATMPSNESMKQSVLSAAQNMAADFHAMNSSLDDLEESIGLTVEREILQLNTLLEQVAEINEQLLMDQGIGTASNDLRDQRDRLITQISELAKVQVVESQDGSATVVLGGRTVVSRGNATAFELLWEEQGDELEMKIVTAATKHEIDLPEGKLEGLITSRDEHIADARQELDDLARLIVEKVNELHVEGRSGSSSGLQFFTGDSSSNIAVNETIAGDYRRIATSRSGEAGDNDIALEIAALANSAIDSGSNESLMDRYRTVIVRFASQRSRYEFLVENQDNVVDAVESRLESVRGVSMDEEGANLVKYQQSYEAAARVITAVTEMFTTLVQLGR